MALNNLTSWNFKTKHVQGDQLGNASPTGNNYVSSESIVICAVMPGTAGGAEDLYPIGVLEGASAQQQKQINQLFEIGSVDPFFIPGKTLIQLQLTRVVFNGDSLMAALYLPDGEDSTGGPYVPDPGPESTDSRMYFNLASDLFNRGADIALVIADSDNDPLGTIIFRECMIQSHGLNIGANQTVVAESISLRSRRVESLSVTSGGNG